MNRPPCFGPAVPAALIFAVLFALAAPAPTAAQTPGLFDRTPVFMVGYAANAPQLFFGGGGAYVWGDWGVYADVKWSHDNPARDSFFDAATTRERAETDFRDARGRQRETWHGANAAVIRRISSDFGLYAGAGATDRRSFFEFYDATIQRGNEGYYWVEDPDLRGVVPNFLGGMLLQTGRRIVVQFGVETEPRGFTVGAMFGTPVFR
jgi:hypothetical protein